MRAWLFGLAVGCALFSSVVARGQDGGEPQNYRTGDYRAPTPSTLKGARVITTAEAEALWRGGEAVFVDVMPRVPRPANLPAGTIWRDKPRLNIPGSIWLPDTGYGELASVTEEYLRKSLAYATAGNPAKPLVIYCLEKCWMSWNAAKRVLAMGYTNVSWYPEGTDGWSLFQLPLEEAVPASGE